MPPLKYRFQRTTLHRRNPLSTSTSNLKIPQNTSASARGGGRPTRWRTKQTSCPAWWCGCCSPRTCSSSSATSGSCAVAWVSQWGRCHGGRTSSWSLPAQCYLGPCRPGASRRRVLGGYFSVPLFQIRLIFLLVVLLCICPKYQLKRPEEDMSRSSVSEEPLLNGVSETAAENATVDSSMFTIAGFVIFLTFS